jgi:hypothetical protein
MIQHAELLTIYRRFLLRASVLYEKKLFGRFFHCLAGLANPIVIHDITKQVG